MTPAAVRARDRVLLWTVTGVVLLLLLWAAGRPAVCAASDPPTGSCPQDGRIRPAIIGILVTVGLALVVAAAARRHAGRRADGISRSEGIVALGVMAIVVVGIVFVGITLFAAGFALIL